MTTFYILRWLEHYGPNTPPEMTGPRLGVREERYGRDALTSSGGGWQMWPDNPEILETLELEDWDAAVLYYIKKYHAPRPNELHISAGWVSPTGVFYACSPEGHDLLATAITASQWQSLDGVSLLERYGWARVAECGVVHRFAGGRAFTEPQRQVFAKLADLDGGDDDWNSWLRWAAEENQ